MSRWRNWSGRVECEPKKTFHPSSEDEIEWLVQDLHQTGGKLRVAGSGHSFSNLVETEATLVSLDEYTGILNMDPEAQSATVRAGTPLSKLGAELHSHGLATSNLGDIDKQTLAGAISTGTHGTGINFGVLSTQLSEIRLMTPGEGWIECSPEQNPEIFRAAQVSLGALGILAELTLDLEEHYRLREGVRKRSVEEVLKDIEELRDENRHFEFFWFPGTDTALVKTLNETDEPISEDGGLLGETVENALFETLCRTGTWVPSLAPVLNRIAARGADERTAVGPPHEIFPTERSVRFNEMEYGVPAEDGPAVFRELRNWIESEHPEVQFPVEYRYVQGDDIPLSPAYGNDRAFLAVHKYHRKPYEQFLRGAEEIFKKYDGRPHWGKIHYRTAEELRNLYPEWETFRSVRRKLDPEGIFLNRHLEELFDE